MAFLVYLKSTIKKIGYSDSLSFCGRSLQSSAPSLNLGDSFITYFECVKNLGAIFDSPLSTKDHIKSVRRSSLLFFATLFILVLAFLESVLKQLSMFFFASHVSYCNFFVILPGKISTFFVQNYAVHFL